MCCDSAVVMSPVYSCCTRRPVSVLLQQEWRRQQKNFIAVMLSIGTHRAWVFMVLMLLCSIHSCLAASVQHDLGQSEVAPNKPNMTVKGVFESILNFFRPVTCRLSNERPTIPCHVESLNRSECLNNHCCPMKIGQDLQCYMPVKDDVQLAIRLILLVGGGFLTLGFLPICCCAVLQRSPCINPLQRMSKKVQQIARKRRAHGEESNDDEVHHRLLD